MTQKKIDLDPNKIDLEDIGSFFKKKKKKIFSIGCVFFILALAAASYQNPRYVIKGVFQEGSIESDGFYASKLQSFFKDNVFSLSQTQAVSVMRARFICAPLIAKIGFQAKIRRPFFVEWRQRLKRRGQGDYAPKDFSCVFIEDVVFAGYASARLTIKKIEGMWEICEGKSRWNVPEKEQKIVFSKGSFCIKPGTEPWEKIEIEFFSMDKTIDQVLRDLKIKPRRDERNILDISYKDTSLIRGKAFVNGLMQNYLSYLEKQKENISQKQLAYLHQRQEDIKQDFSQSLKQHASYLEQSLHQQGFLALAQHLEKIEREKNHRQDKKRQLNLRLQILEQLSSARSYAFQDPFLKEISGPLQDGLSLIAKEREQLLLSSMTTKIKAPWSLAANLHNNPLEKKQFYQQNFFKAAREKSTPYNLKQAQDSLAQAKKFLDQLEEKKRGFLIASQKLQEDFYSVETLKEWIEDIESFPHYLKLLSYSSQLKDPYFSLKEKQRILEDFTYQAKLLTQHILLKIEALDEKILKHQEKMLCLEQKVLDLLQKEESFLERQIRKRWQEKKELLALEDLTNQKELEVIAEEEKKLPGKWLKENHLRLEADLNLALMEGLSHMIESKNMEFNLAQLHSTILDEAYASLKPEALLMVPFAILIAALGCFGAGGLEMLVAIKRGFPLSIKGLQHRGIEALERQDRLAFHNYLQELFLIQQREIVTFFFKKDMDICWELLGSCNFVIEITNQGEFLAEQVIQSFSLENTKSFFSISPFEALKLLHHPDFFLWSQKILTKYSLIFCSAQLQEDSFLAKTLCKQTKKLFVELREHTIEQLEHFICAEDPQKLVVFDIQERSL